MKRTTIALAIAIVALSFAACSTGLESPSLDDSDTETVETTDPVSSGPSWLQQLINAALEKARQEALAKAKAAAVQQALDDALEGLPVPKLPRP